LSIDGAKIQRLSIDEMVKIIKEEALKDKVEYLTIFSPVVRGRKGEYYQLLYDYLNLGYSQARIDNKIYSLHDKIELSRYQDHTIEIIIDKVSIKDESRLFEAVENALNYSNGLVNIGLMGDNKFETYKREFLLSSHFTCPNDNFAFPEVEPRLFSF